MQHTSSEQQKKYEFEQLELERLLTNELTYASEALAAPMDNPFEYTLHDDDLWYQGETIRSHLDSSVQAAREITALYPHFRVELQRRTIELDEYDSQLALAKGTDDSPTMLVVMSPIPDAVLGGIELGAYDTQRKKTMLRIYTKTRTGIRTRSVSVDLSDRDGLRAIAARFGEVIPDDATSEDILAMRLWGWADEYQDDPAVTLRRVYDDELSSCYGGEWFAGRQDDIVTNSLDFIRAQPDLVSQHMSYVNGATKTFPKGPRLDYELKQLRYNFVEALSRRLRGDPELSMPDAGDAARATGIEHKTDCPDGTGLGATQQSLEQIGVGTKTFMCQACPICGAEKITAIMSGELIRGVECGCSRNICTGTVVRGPGRPAIARQSLPSTASRLRQWRHDKQQADADLDKPSRVLERHEGANTNNLVKGIGDRALRQPSVAKPSEGGQMDRLQGASDQIRIGSTALPGGKTFSVNFGRVSSFIQIEIGGGKQVMRDVFTGELVKESNP